MQAVGERRWRERRAAGGGAAAIDLALDGVAPVTVKLTGGVLSLVGPVGPLVIVTVGAVKSIVQVKLAVALLPASSRSRTVNVWEPAVSAEKLSEIEHGTKPPASSLQVGLFSVFVTLNVNAAVVALVGLFGWVRMVTTGGMVSTVMFVPGPARVTGGIGGDDLELVWAVGEWPHRLRRRAVELCLAVNTAPDRHRVAGRRERPGRAWSDSWVRWGRS